MWQVLKKYLIPYSSNLQTKLILDFPFKEEQWLRVWAPKTVAWVTTPLIRFKSY